MTKKERKEKVSKIATTITDTIIRIIDKIPEEELSPCEEMEVWRLIACFCHDTIDRIDDEFDDEERKHAYEEIFWN